MMNISYGICVGKNHNTEYMGNLIRSIRNQNNDKYEILLIGENLNQYAADDVEILFFDESERSGWITKKKNILAKYSRYDIVCILHDYILLDDNWLNGVRKATEEIGNWNVLLNEVVTFEGTRHSDWQVSPFRMEELINKNPKLYVPMLMNVAPHENHPKYICGLPYDVTDLTHVQYISGGIIFCKRELFTEVPMNENMIWGDAPGEDVEWSERLSKKSYLYNFNRYSKVHLQKSGKWKMYQMPNEFVIALREYYGSKL